MKTLIVLSLLISLPAWAGWVEKVKAKLPTKVQSISLGTDRSSAQKILGAPDLHNGDKEYWIIDGFKYALELTYKNNKVVSLHYNFPDKNFSVEDLKGDLNPGNLKVSTSSHTTSIYEDRSGKLEIELASGKVESVRFR